MKNIILMCLFSFFSILISDTIIYKESYGMLGNSVDNYQLKNITISDLTKSGVTYISESGEVSTIPLKQIVSIEYNNGEKLKKSDIKQLLKDVKKNNLKLESVDITYIGENWSNETKMLFYHKEKKSPEDAIFYEMSSFLPLMNLGYAYTDNWKRGAMWDGIIIGSLLLAESKALRGGCVENWGDNDSVPDYHCEEYDEEDYKYENSTGKKILYLGAISVLIYKYIDVYQLAEKYNDNLYNSLFNEPRPYFSLQATTESVNLAFNIPIR